MSSTWTHPINVVPYGMHALTIEARLLYPSLCSFSTHIKWPLFRSISFVRAVCNPRRIRLSEILQSLKGLRERYK